MATDAMTSRERIDAALQGGAVDRLPFSPFLAYVWDFMPQDVKDAGQLAFLQRIGADPLWRGAACSVREIPPEMEVNVNDDGRLRTREVKTPVGSIHSAWQYSEDGNTTFHTEHPLKSEEDYKVMLWIEERTRYEYDPSPLENHLNGQGGEGLTIAQLIPRCKSAYQMMIEHYAGTEELNYALMDFPEVVEELWGKMVENDLLAARLSAQAPADYFLTWEDSSTQNYSPDQYRRYIGSEIRQWCDILKERGKHYIQHACGHMADLLQPLMEDGALAVESLSTPPTGNVTLKEAREKVGGGLGIIGGIEPTAFLNLSLEELPGYVEEVVEGLRGGPFLLANSDSCPPGVTEEKFRLVAETAKNIAP